MRRILRDELAWVVLPLIGLPLAWAAWRLYAWHMTPDVMCVYIIF